MTTKKTKTSKEEVVDASLLPEIKSTATLNLALTKDDLVDILIDQEIKKLETTIQDCETGMRAIEKSRKEFNDKQKAIRDKVILSRIPKEFQALAKKYYDPENTSFSYSSNTEVVFYDSVGKRVFGVYNMDTQVETPEFSETLTENYRNFQKTIQESQEKIKQLEKSPRRVKAQLLTQFLNNSDEGKNILSMLKQDGLKLIG